MRKAISWVLGLSNQLKRHPAAIFFGILITITSCETSCYVFMSLFSQLLFMSTNIGGSIIMSANTSDNHPNSDSAGFQNPFNNMAQQTALPPSYDDAPQLAASTSLGYTPSGKPRLHQCLVCLRSFARLEHLKRHERSHTKEKPFNCGVCSRKFSRRDLLLRHAEKLHGGCAEAVQRLRRRRRSAVKKDEDGAGSGSTTVAVSSQVTVPDTIPDLNVSINDNNERAKPRKLSSIADFGNRGPVASNGPPLSTFVTDYGRRNSSNADQDVEMMSRPHALKVRVNSLFNNFISRNSTRSNSIVNEENPPNLKRVRRASFSASSGENYAMPKYLPSNMAIDQLHINNYVNQNPSNHFYADSVEFSTPQFLPNEEELKDGTNPMIPKLHNIPEISLNSDNSYDVNTHNSNFNFNIPNFEKPQEQELRKIGQNVDNLHLSQQKNKLDNTKMDVDEKDSSLYGDYNIYGIESPDAEDWVNKVLGSSQIEFLTNIKNSNFETNNNKPTITEEKQKTNNVYDDFSKRINDFQNQLNKFSSDESSSYSTNVKNSPNNNTETKDNQNGDGPENEFGLLYGYSFYSDDFYGLSEPKLSKQMNEHLKNSFGIYGNPKNAIKKDNSSTDNDRKLKSEEISQEYDLISELNNLQNFQFYLNNSSKEGLSQMKKSALANNMNRNDSGKSTNSTQTMVSSNSSNQEQLLNNLIQSNGATSTDSKNAMPHSNNNGNLYFQHFNNISNGYSYYGVNVNNSMATPSDLSSSNINSPIRNVSPKMLESNNSSNIFLNRNYSQQLNSLTTSNPRPIRMPLTSKTNGHPETKQSPKTKLLFSKYSRSKIFKTLLKYPFIGIPSPTIVDNQRLNEFVGVFCDKFINHMPFIHEFFLTEANMDKLTSCYWESSSLSNAKDQNPKEGSEDSVSDEKDAAAVCLPLLVATLGAIVSNNKREASNLYEASRRCIHVYLDSRKKNNLTPNNSSPLWLIQSLTLSVIYGLFAEFDSSSEIILKQVNALIALIRSSNLNKLKFDQLAYNKEPQKRNKEVLLLIYESKIRTVYTIFNISNLLNYFYGLKIEKIFNINEMYLKLPNFELNFHSTLGENSTSCVHIDINTPDFQTVLHKLVNKEVLDEKVSAYGLVSLQFGLHQYLALRDSNVYQDEDLLERWDLNFMSQIPRYMNKNHELFYNDSCNLLRLDARVLGNYLVFKHFSKSYINLNKIRYSSVWSKSWKKIAKTLVEANEKTTDNLALRSELQSVKFGIKILIDLFFVEDAVLMNSGLPTSNGLDNDENDLFAIGIIDNMVSKKSFTKILSLNLQILFDIFLVLCKFSFNFEKYCNGIDGVVINSIKQGPTTSNNQHGSSLGLLFEDDHGNRHIGNDSILGLLNNQSFMKKLKYYKLILGIFSKLEEFSVLHYGLESHSSMSQTNNLDNLAVMEEKHLRYKTSLKILRVGEFLFDKIFDEELGFNIFQNLGEGLLQLRKYLVWEIEKTNV